MKSWGKENVNEKQKWATKNHKWNLAHSGQMLNVIPYRTQEQPGIVFSSSIFSYKLISVIEVGFFNDHFPMERQKENVILAAFGH